jgi:hypothetical protein
MVFLLWERIWRRERGGLPQVGFGCAEIVLVQEHCGCGADDDASAIRKIGADVDAIGESKAPPNEAELSERSVLHDFKGDAGAMRRERSSHSQR